MKIKNILISNIFLLILLFSFCIKKDTKEIKLGAVLPLTGDIASYGRNAQSGIDIAVGEINAKGGINKKKLIIIYEDDKGRANEAVKIVQKLCTSDKVPVIMGSAASSVTMAICPIINENKVVLISPISSSKELTKKGGPYFFRVCPSDAFQSKILADWIWKEGLKSAGIIYVNNSWGVGLKDEFVNIYENIGGRIAAIETSLESAKDFKTQISKVMAKKPEVLLAITYGIEGGILLKQVKELNFNIPIFGADVWSSPELLTSAGNAAEEVRFTLPVQLSGVKFETFAEKYRLIYNKEPDIYSAYSYDMLNIIANALKNGNINGDQIRNYLLEMPAFEGITELTKFDEYGDCNTKPFARQQIIDGKYINIHF